jgi:hypothetical protein
LSHQQSRRAGEADPGAAIAHYQRALSIWAKSGESVDPRAAYALLGLGEARLAQHAPGDAVTPLERALPLLEASGADAASLEQARALLARARQAQAATR